jgi:hypothetical protein
MSIWKAWHNETHVGWHSPVSGPVHPALVPIHDASGIGWLEGFDELLVRCGLTSNGAPEFGSDGRLLWTLHGRIANLPATALTIEIDSKNGYVDIVGIVPETRFLVSNLELKSRYRLRPMSARVEVTDEVTNRSSQSATMQLLYHINVGKPILNKGCRIVTAHSTVSPRDSRAAEGLDGWETCAAPTPGYAEQVYFLEPRKNANGISEAALINDSSQTGISICFDTATLPYLTIWKNTAAESDGYVVGIEPATGLPNPRSVEENAGRLIELQGGQSRCFSVSVEPLNGADAITKAQQRIARVGSDV